MSQSSAIPSHLREPRTREASTPDGYRPAYPSFAAWTSPDVRHVVIAFLGAQGDAGTGDLDAALAAGDGPRHYDRAISVGRVGSPEETVTAAYWTDPLAFERWFDTHRDAWLSPRAGGRWVEAVRPSVRRVETILGSRRRPEGLAVVAGEMSEEVVEHGYWGSMRDRMAASSTEAMDDPLAPETVVDGGRVRIRGRGSVCLIRSGQDWSDTRDDERDTYLGEIEPLLGEGMDFLAGPGGAGAGCLSNRYLTVLDEDGAPTERTYGLGWWQTMADLERWSASHPSHLAIFGAFGRAVRDQGGRSALRLYHEVVVAAPHEQWFEYAGCVPGTGLLAGPEHR
ncbi:hypothetical protein AD006_30930 (plasmid) [Pseudonocardia sp. EC080610-09]|uniref:phenylacetaldoxime dehydratase family protein n=1 Tax=unclassified Pseudonocardia TaxID=2619320 RepID=UPI000706CD8E|nr:MULTISPECIES: phenylacetaldoxime dehydratase family protein [unclassified Pseudonocardia]ALL79615.1 hypothetical protein AD006_30930 [Pseudonocardia sp. EC080610-09]ALL85429.1 hypothetical protein AD017_30305 [Pseudonocardia sp. EC080619-01]